MPPSCTAICSGGRVRAAEARAAYERAAGIAPDQPAPLLALAELVVETDPAAAARSYESALLHLAATDHARVDALLKLGAAWQAAGEPARATAAWEEAAALEPGNQALRWQLGQAYEKAGKLENAVAAYREIADRAAPNDCLNALREISRLEQTRENFEGARTALEQALALTARGHWMRPDLQQQLTRLYLRAGRGAEHEQRVQAEVERNPRDPAPLLLLANLYDELGDAAKQAAALEKAVKLTPGDRDVRLRLARVLADAGELTAAAEQYDLLLRESGRVPPDWVLARADFDLQMGRPADAVARVGKLLSTDGSDDSVRAACLAYYQRNRFEAEAEALLKAEHERSPGNDETTLALVEYYFAQKKPEVARALLERWTASRSGEGATVRAARLERAAEILKSHGYLPEVSPLLREAIALDASSGTARRVALADAMIGTGETEPARRELEAAYAGAKSDAERIEVDDKLFVLLQNLGASATTSASPGSRSLVPARDNPIIREFLRDMDYAAREGAGHAEIGLRLARFYARGGAPADAIEAALRALRIKPDLLSARELVVRLAAETGRRELLAEQLQAIIKLDPAGRSKHQRRLAYARLEEGALTAAIALFREIEAMNPGSDEAMADLATALQRAERWSEAVAAWERAYALPRVAKNHAEYRQPFMLALEKVGAAQRAAELLAAAADEETDAVRRVELFRDVVAYAQRWNLLLWLEARAEARVRAAPLDYFAASSLAELRRAQGRDREAYELLTRAYYGAPDPAAALQNLVRTAEDLGDTRGALRHQRRLLHVAGQLTAENLERLAALEESDLDFDGAARTWGQIVNRFPRDPAALARAADYFRKNELPAREREVLTKLVAVDSGRPFAAGPARLDPFPRRRAGGGAGRVRIRAGEFAAGAGQSLAADSGDGWRRGAPARARARLAPPQQFRGGGTGDRAGRRARPGGQRRALAARGDRAALADGAGERRPRGRGDEKMDRALERGRGDATQRRAGRVGLQRPHGSGTGSPGSADAKSRHGGRRRARLRARGVAGRPIRSSRKMGVGGQRAASPPAGPDARWGGSVPAVARPRRHAARAGRGAVPASVSFPLRTLGRRGRAHLCRPEPLRGGGGTGRSLPGEHANQPRALWRGDRAVAPVAG